MNANNITVITLAVLWLAAIAVVVYDRIKYNKYYSSQGKLIVLRFNDSAARKALEEQGFNLCQCAYFNTNVISSPPKVTVSAVSRKNALILSRMLSSIISK